MSHLVQRIRDQENLKEKISTAHMMLVLEVESTAEILLWDDPKSVERLMDEIKHLIKSMPEEFKDAEVNRDPENDIGYSVSMWWDQFFNDLDLFIVNVYRGGNTATFLNAARTLLHYAEMYLEEIANVKENELLR